MKIGDRIFVRGYIDEIRKDTVIVRNDGGYFGTIPSEVITGELPSAQLDVPDTNVGDMISRQAATTIPVMPKEHRHYQTNNLDDAYEQGWNDLQECIENLPTVQPDEKLEKCRFEYINACRIVTNPTPDTTKKDISDAYAVIKVLQPIFGDVTF